MKLIFIFPVVNCFEDVCFSDFRFSGEVCDGSCHLQDPVVGAGTEFVSGDRLSEEGETSGIGDAVFVEFPRGHLGVAVNMVTVKPFAGSSLISTE